MPYVSDPIRAALLRYDEGAAPRQRVKLCGVIRGVTLRPVGGVPALEAELYDGSGTLSIIWLGRRRIAGIDPGVHLVVEGRIGDQHGHLTMFNPAYTLKPGH